MLRLTGHWVARAWVAMCDGNKDREGLHGALLLSPTINAWIDTLDPLMELLLYGNGRRSLPFVYIPLGVAEQGPTWPQGPWRQSNKQPGLRGCSWVGSYSTTRPLEAGYYPVSRLFGGRVCYPASKHYPAPPFCHWVVCYLAQRIV
ncbi:hypothetical protein Fot_32535 [Forsythia ovata]|uniref:Uncharacterized protein n=1 Tax=Forsythia ovata TaxID=205694 RepID=A0ABD1T834_9LAMI